MRFGGFQLGSEGLLKRFDRFSPTTGSLFRRKKSLLRHSLYKFVLILYSNRTALSISFLSEIFSYERRFFRLMHKNQGRLKGESQRCSFFLRAGGFCRHRFAKAYAFARNGDDRLSNGRSAFLFASLAARQMGNPRRGYNDARAFCGQVGFGGIVSRRLTPSPEMEAIPCPTDGQLFCLPRLPLGKEGTPSLAGRPLLKNNPPDCFLIHPLRSARCKGFRILRAATGGYSPPDSRKPFEKGLTENF